MDSETTSGAGGGRKSRRTELAELNWFTPMPPARNGIADYAYKLLEEMRQLRTCTVYCDDALAMAPGGVEIRDAAQAFRDLRERRPILHQIGNNAGHVFVLEALRRHGGVVGLHDLGLLYLYELASDRLEPIVARMEAQNPRLGSVFGRQWRDSLVKTEANYVLFDMVGEILSRADGVIVHSRFGLNKLRSVYGEEAVSHVHVVPHYAPAPAPFARKAARARLGIDPGDVLILTSGFATRAKRFDWLIEALRALGEKGIAFRWIHAGEERPGEFRLAERIAASPGLQAASTITGYLEEDDLDAYLLASDIVVNLRFPSVGESSGTLARAFSAGRCCLVSDTAAYAELPRDAVIHIPIVDAAPALTRALEALIGDRDLIRTFGERARLHARTSLGIAGIAKSYAEAIDASYARPPKDRPRPSPARASNGIERFSIEGTTEADLRELRRRVHAAQDAFEAVLWFGTASEMAEHSLDMPGFMNGAFGPSVAIETVRFVSRSSQPRRQKAGSPAGSEEVGLSVVGRVFAS